MVSGRGMVKRLVSRGIPLTTLIYILIIYPGTSHAFNMEAAVVVTSGTNGSTPPDPLAQDDLMAEGNGTTEFPFSFGEGNVFYFETPEDMLNPSMRNPAFYPILITHVLTFVVGFIGNVIAIVVLWREGKGRNVTTLFLVSLSASDLLLIITCVPLEMLQYFLQFDNNWVLCKTARYMELVSASASVFNLCAVSLERYIVIVHPMKARSLCTLGNCYKAIICIWFASFLVSVPVLKTKEGYSVTYTNSITSVTIFYCEEEDVSEGLPIAIYKFVMLFVTSFVFMMVCYFFVIRALWKSTRDIKILTNSASTPGKGNENSGSEAKPILSSSSPSALNNENDACATRENKSGTSFPQQQQLQLLSMKHHDNASSCRSSPNGSFVSATGFDGDGDPDNGSYSRVPETKETGKGPNFFKKLHQTRNIMPRSSTDKSGQFRAGQRRPQTVNKGGKTGDDPKATRKQVIKMLIMIVFLFLVCWGPKLILLVILKIAFIQGYPIYSQIVYMMRVTFNLIPLVHSCINPIVYCFMSRNFRRAMRQQLGRCCASCDRSSPYGAQRDDVNTTTTTGVSAWRSTGTTGSASGTQPRPHPNTITQAVVEPTNRENF